MRKKIFGLYAIDRAEPYLQILTRF